MRHIQVSVSGHPIPPTPASRGRKQLLAVVIAVLAFSVVIGIAERALHCAFFTRVRPTTSPGIRALEGLSSPGINSFFIELSAVIHRMLSLNNII